MTWIPRGLTGGVVTTREPGRGELVSAEFCRLLQGDPLRLHPDYRYDEWLKSGTALNANRTILLMEYMNFDGRDPVVAFVTTAVGITSLWIYNAVTKAEEVTAFIPAAVATQATKTHRGNQYFIGTDVGNWVVENDAGTIVVYRMGLDPSTVTTSVESSFPQLGANLWVDNSGRPWLQYNEVIGNLYTNFLELPGSLKTEIQNAAYGAVGTSLPPLVLDWVEIVGVKLKALGDVYQFAYWVTEYVESRGIESGPGPVGSLPYLDPSLAYWEVTFSLNPIIQNPDSFIQGEPIRSQIYDEVVELWNSRGLTGTMALPLSDLHKEQMRAQVTIGGSLANSGAEVRLYRQNLGAVNKFEADYAPGPTNPSLVFEGGSGPQVLEEIVAGRQARQGGRLAIVEVGDTYEDNLLESGVADPGVAYPTVVRVENGQALVYEYLGKPEPFVVSATIGDSVLKVPASNRQIIQGSPNNDPEQQPPIFVIPVISEREDRIVAIQPLRDVAVVFTETAAMRLNYLPFEGSGPRDRVFTNITSYHGAINEKLVTTVETPSGQLAVWLSRTGLMATNGFGFEDMCPDFSVRSAGVDVTRAVLVNNPREYRLELWDGGTRWDFYYHRTHMKDVRGDGVGLVFKLMGPTMFYDEATVLDVTQGPVSDEERVFVLRRKSGEKAAVDLLGNSFVSQRSVAISGLEYGSTPWTTLRVRNMGIQNNSEVDQSIRLYTDCVDVDEGNSQRSGGDIRVNPGRRFSWKSIESGVGSGAVFTVDFKGQPVGPLWLDIQESNIG